MSRGWSPQKGETQVVIRRSSALSALSVLSVLLVQASSHAAPSSDWPGWRGLEREGRAAPGNYPTEWSPDPSPAPGARNIRWKTPIPGKGHSSPIVVGDSVLVTTGYPAGRGETLRRLADWGTLGLAAVVALCAGAWLVLKVCRFRLRVPRWAKWFAAAVVAVGALGFVMRNYLQVTKEFARAIVCLDRDTGAVKWIREGLRGPQPPMSHRNSPATPTPTSNGEWVVAWFGSAGAFCTDLSGKVLWTSRDVPFEDVHGVGASPLFLDGLVAFAGAQPDAPYIRTLSSHTGERVWSVSLRPWPGGEGQHRTPSLVTVGGKRVLLVWTWDGPEKDGHLRAFAADSGQPLWSYPVGTEGEQVASVVSDGGAVFLPTSRAVTALSLSRLSRGEAPVLWTTGLKCRGQLVASPVLCNGLLFVASAHRDAHCLDPKTGELLWSQQLNGRGCMASPIAAGGAVYFPDVSGKITAVAAERAFRRIAENDLGEPIWASPAPVGGRLYVRTAGHLWCIEEKP